MGSSWWWTRVVDAGWTMLPLAVCSVMALAVFLHKLVEFTSQRLGSHKALDLVRPLIAAGELEGAAQAAAGVGGPLGRVLAATVGALAIRPATAPGTAERASKEELDRFEAWLPLLAFVVQAAPMLGFLGTAIGMVDLFAQLELSGQVADAGAVSGGIWKALLTTVAGLTIALPSMAAHAWASRRLQRLALLLEGAVSEVLQGRTP